MSGRLIVHLDDDNLKKKTIKAMGSGRLWLLGPLGPVREDELCGPAYFTLYRYICIYIKEGDEAGGRNMGRSPASIGPRRG